MVNGFWMDRSKSSFGLVWVPMSGATQLPSCYSDRSSQHCCEAHILYSRWTLIALHCCCLSPPFGLCKCFKENQSDLRTAKRSNERERESNGAHGPTKYYFPMTDDPVVIIVLVELEAAEEVFRTKIRIRQSEIGSAFTVQDLRRKIQSSLDYNTNRSLYCGDEPILMSLWDKNHAWRPLNDARENLLELSSTRWKVRLTVEEDDFKDPLPIQGRYYAFDGTLSIDEHTTLRILETTNVCDTTALNVWDGSILMAQYLISTRTAWKDQSILELGAGCGVSGLTAAALGASKVVLTDLSDALSQLRRTIQWNGLDDKVCAIECDWTQPLSEQLSNGVFDWILVADCVWLEELVAPLLNVLVALTNLPTKRQQTTNDDHSPQCSMDNIYQTDNNLSDPQLPEPPSDCEGPTSTPPPTSQPLQQILERLSSGVDEEESPNPNWSTTNSTPPRILISYQQRGKATHESFIKGLHEWFHVEAIDFHDKPSSVFYLLSCTRK